MGEVKKSRPTCESRVGFLKVGRLFMKMYRKMEGDSSRLRIQYLNEKQHRGGTLLFPPAGAELIIFEDFFDKQRNCLNHPYETIW